MWCQRPLFCIIRFLWIRILNPHLNRNKWTMQHNGLKSTMKNSNQFRIFYFFFLKTKEKKNVVYVKVNSFTGWQIGWRAISLTYTFFWCHLNENIDRTSERTKLSLLSHFLENISFNQIPHSFLPRTFSV